MKYDYDNLTKENFFEHLEIFEHYIYFFVKLERELKGQKTQFQDFLEFRNNEQNIIESDLLQIFDSKDVLEKKESNIDKILKIHNKINERFYKLISFSEGNDIFFRMCTLKTYVITFEKRLEKYLKKNIVLDKKDFLLKEIDSILNPNNFTENREFFNEISKRIIINSREKKVEFLKNKLLDLNIIVKVFEIDYKRPKPKHIQSFDYNEAQIKTLPQQTINESEPEQKTPYKIALLNELGFFKLDAIQKLSKTNQYKVISTLIGAQPRTIKGNILVLNPDSNENRMTYTSNNHVDEVKNYLDKLK